MYKWLVLFILAFAFICLIVVVAKAENVPEAPPKLEESTVQDQMAELGLVIPKALQDELNGLRWVAWRIVTIPIGQRDEGVIFCIKYLTQGDLDRYNQGEVYRGDMLKAEIFFCIKHKDVYYMRWFHGNIWHEKQLHKRPMKPKKKPSLKRRT